MKKYYLFIFIIFFISCNKEKSELELFNKLTVQHSGIDFFNKIEDTKHLNIIDYLYYYNGGGVAAGDINNDGLTDLFFTSNLGDNKLYLNKGHLKFEDISNKAGITGNSDWNSGAVMADVNGDGWLDIYVCAVVGIHNFEGHNELYINNKDNTFTESAKIYNLDIKAYSSNAAFFDYDKDGDLDMYLLNHAIHTQDSYLPKERAHKKYTYESSDKLFNNNGFTFEDVSKQSGIIGGVISYGLGVRVADFNNDGWEDIFVSNDFHEDDYLYINEKDGTFKESGSEYFAHTSNFSMGTDAADINNDGYLDLMVLDMLSENEEIIKTSVGDTPYDLYQYRLKFGYNYQFARNVLQLNNQGKSFSDVALMNGVAATDWSWSPLFADFDNDGLQDLFITTGILKRPNNLDYIKFISSDQIKKSFNTSRFLDEKALKIMPDGKVHNYIFKGTHNGFEKKHIEWGMSEPIISTGSALADFDNDGDLDLALSCINDTSFIYENKSDTSNNFNLQIQLKGNSQNSFGIGSKVYVFTKQSMQYQQLSPYRGFQSSSQPILHFGLGQQKTDSIVIIWPDNRYQKIVDPPVNKMLVLNQNDAKDIFSYKKPISSDKSLFKDISELIEYTHKENSFLDFNREKLLQYKVSTQGPALAVGDVNNNGLEDVYIGGARGHQGKLFVQENGHFILINNEDFINDKVKEDVDAVFVDIDNDKDLDLIIASAGNEFFGKSKRLKDRIYVNDGKGNFSKKELLPEYFENTACIRPADYDNDGDIDLFVGGRVVAKAFGTLPNSYLFQNDGTGKFTEIPVKHLKNIGMVTDALWYDYDNDNDKDLMLVGEWMSPVFFENDNGKLKKSSGKFTKNLPTGLWQEIELYDIDNDGDKDILLGNWGLNNKMKASVKYPFLVYVKDFDDNGTLEQIFAYEKNGKYYPVHTKDELCNQIVKLNKKFVKYEDYAGKTIEEIIGKNELKKAAKLSIEMLESAYLENNNYKYKLKKLPYILQDAPIYKFFSENFDNDNNEDLIIAGNMHGVTPYQGKLDANNGKIIFSSSPMNIENLQNFGINFFNKEIRNIKPIQIGNKKCFIVAVNNNNLMLVQINN